MTPSSERINTGPLMPYSIEPLPGTAYDGVETQADALDVAVETLGLDPSAIQGIRQGQIVEASPESTGLISRGFVACSALAIQSEGRIFFGHVWPNRTDVGRGLAALGVDVKADPEARILVARGSASYPESELQGLIEAAGDRAVVIEADTGPSWWTVGLNLENGELRIAYAGHERGVAVYDTPIRRELE